MTGNVVGAVSISLPEIKAATRKRDCLRDEQFQGKITTREVFQRELTSSDSPNIECAIRTARGQLSAVKPFAGW
jgi:hypothetical protein